MLSPFSLALLLASAPPTSPPRIVSVGGAVTETVFALGLGDQVVAVDRTSVYPPSVHGLANVGLPTQLSAEGILGERPTLVVGADSIGPPAVLEQLRAAGVEVRLLSAEKNLKGAEARIRGLAEAFDRRAEGARLWAAVEEGLKALPPPPVPAPRVLFIYARGAGNLTVAGQGTAADEMIRLAGAQNAATGFEQYRPLTAEGLVGAQPDVLLLTTTGLDAIGGRTRLLEVPGVNLTPAGKRQHVVVLEDSLLLSFGPRTAVAASALRAALAEAKR